MFLSNRRSRWDPLHTRTHTPSPLAPFFSPVMSFCKHPCSSKDIYLWPPANLFFSTSTDPPNTVAIFHTLTQPSHLDSILWGILDPIHYLSPVTVLGCSTPRSEVMWLVLSEEPMLNFSQSLFSYRPFVNPLVKWPGLATSAAAAKSPQSCPTLCDPIDGSPPGSPVPGILQARILECVAILSPA